MSLKRILGTMLATRMAGRGRRGGALGTASMLGGRGRRSSGMGGKMGLAALGYMAYRAYQDHQSKSAGGGTASAGSGSGSAGRSGSGGGIAGMVQEVIGKVTGDGTSGSAAGGSGEPARQDAPREEDMQEEARAAERMSDDTALLLIRAMISAAYADGSLSTEERQRIVDAIEEADGTEEDRAVMEREIANPKPVDELLGQVSDEETAEEFYMASRAAIDGETEANRAYLADLRQRLGLSEAQAADVEEMTA